MSGASARRFSESSREVGGEGRVSQPIRFSSMVSDKRVAADRARPFRRPLSVRPRRLERWQSAVPDAHYVFAQQNLLILDLLEKALERISRVEHAKRPSVLVDDGDILEATLLHD